MITTKTKQKKTLYFSKCQVTITFVPLKPVRRDDTYHVWVETWLRAERNKLAKKLAKNPDCDIISVEKRKT